MSAYFSSRSFPTDGIPVAHDVLRGREHGGLKTNLACPFFLLVLIVLITGCGKKGDLKYPEYFAPSDVSNLRAERDGADVLVTWTSPEKTSSGGALKDLESFIIKRAPFAQRPRAYDFDKIAEVAVDIEREAKEGPLNYEYRDKNVPVQRDFQYQITPVNDSGVEGRSDIVNLQDLPVPSQPANKVLLPSESKSEDNLDVGKKQKSKNILQRND